MYIMQVEFEQASAPARFSIRRAPSGSVSLHKRSCAGEGYVQAALKPQGEPRRDEGPELGELALERLDE